MSLWQRQEVAEGNRASQQVASCRSTVSTARVLELSTQRRVPVTRPTFGSAFAGAFEGSMDAPSGAGAAAPLVAMASVVAPAVSRRARPGSSWPLYRIT